MTMALIAPSLLSADFANLERDTQMINTSNADWFHVDVMDGMFVPNISFGFPVIKAVKKHCKKPLDVHLMIVDPDRYIQQFRDAGADYISVHLEACPHLHRTLQLIKSTGAKAGVAINPHTPVSLLRDVLHDIDLVCMMSVNPGFGGQKFIEHTYSKVSELREMIDEKNTGTLIEIDGGVDLKNAGKLIAAGADVLVAGNTVFSSENPTATIKQLKQISSSVEI
ncbi:MAG: ribulose-phosphate 3-epimerase [Bacteroidetes bacterium]|nr:ribulose-phosphate 3-epimerase [Bacteroidota bacterium]MBK8413412.1 ribulose-phosphate 3-epimerase [Bacteroidota bacterium]MBK8876717.1 ribulose-phosphate 3-epimerase [Bacteroidota bacterium]MBK9046324.1 ribulose-phosphate 3-epimerase [Bacteroidota bacterium]MBK9424912.1 ribulose-phosphate 3-epimerase [Bacteroidota bacterium]